jgi:hypothetical protein
MTIPGVEAGQSGYFSTPSNALDPRLFDGDHIRPEVREWILGTLDVFWARRYNVPELWSTVWLAGSGISYQWAAARGNGDLDVLIGVDWSAFYFHNPEYQGLSAVDVADQFNSEFHADLWPSTAETIIGTNGQVNSAPTGFSGRFEVTFYVNATGSDIRDIHPYAAYNVTTNEWTVTPPVLPHNPKKLYPTTWWDYVHDERRLADSLLQRYNHVQGQVAMQGRGSPAWVTTSRQLKAVQDQISTLYDARRRSPSRDRATGTLPTSDGKPTSSSVPPSHCTTSGPPRLPAARTTR